MVTLTLGIVIAAVVLVALWRSDSMVFQMRWLGINLVTRKRRR